MSTRRPPDRQHKTPRPLDVIRTILQAAQAILSLLRFLAGL